MKEKTDFIEDELKEIQQALKNSKPIYFLFAFLTFVVLAIFTYPAMSFIWCVVIVVITSVKFTFEKIKVNKLLKRKSELEGMTRL